MNRTTKITDVFYDENAGVIKMKLNGFVITRHYRKVWQDALNLSKKHNCQSWLIDLSGFKGAHNRDLEWSFGDWFEEATGILNALGTIPNGRASLLLPNDKVVEYMVNNSLRKTNQERQNMFVQCFSDERSAAGFLIQ